MKHRIVPALLLALAACTPAMIPAPAASTRSPGRSSPAPAVPTAVSIAEMERETHERINRYRASRGLAPLRYSDALADVARRHSQDMAAGRVPFGHAGFEQRAQEVSRTVDYRSIAENVHANDYPAGSAVEVAVSGWIGSPGHLENIVGAYDLTGIGVARSARGTWYFTQLFVGSRQGRARSR